MKPVSKFVMVTTPFLMVTSTLRRWSCQTPSMAAIGSAGSGGARGDDYDLVAGHAKGDDLVAEGPDEDPVEGARLVDEGRGADLEDDEPACGGHAYSCPSTSSESAKSSSSASLTSEYSSSAPSPS